jgi:hypothetical protein
MAAEALARQIREPCGTEAGALHKLGVLECSRGRYCEAASLLAWAKEVLENEVRPDAGVVRACRKKLARIRASIVVAPLKPPRRNSIALPRFSGRKTTERTAMPMGSVEEIATTARRGPRGNPVRVASASISSCSRCWV